ncbi:MAG: hypothetical protein RL518_2149 [Pseudomonadota bacterium]|jgi:Flp pilus assembly protein TadG
MVEFCFTMPVLLLIAGATIDLSRYMRFLQVTTFVSQETAGQIYRQCSDITIYRPPELTTTGLRIDTELTQTAIRSCMERVRAGAQQLLDRTVGRAAVSSKVFRWDLGATTVANTCAAVTTVGTQVTEIYAPAVLNSPAFPEDLKQKLGNDADITQIRWPPIYIPSSSNSTPLSGSSPLSSGTQQALTAPGIQLYSDGTQDGIYQTKSGRSASPRLLVSPSALCQRGRVVTVEVSYAFEPVVKFLPDIMNNLTTPDGSQRDTTVL